MVGDVSPACTIDISIASFALLDPTDSISGFQLTPVASSSLHSPSSDMVHTRWYRHDNFQETEVRDKIRERDFRAKYATT